MKKVRLGIIGVGSMGSHHSRQLLAGKIGRCELTAVCDTNPAQLESFRDHDIAKFEDSRKLIRSGEVDAVLVATPHYGHTTIGIDALEQGLHLLVEKPISVHKADCERLIAAYKKTRGRIFAAMFNQRTVPAFRKIKQLIADGELGEIRRFNWIVTSWFRTEAYYASGGWRATWKGEGGGVLLNQCPHNLDMMQWLCGMPKTMRAFCNLGKHHNIEVEDEVTAYFEYPNGATGTFVTCTGEAPGSDRLEIAGERGKIVFEGGVIRFTRNEMPATEFSRTTKESFAVPSVWNIEVPVRPGGDQHNLILENFTAAILDKAPLIAPASEGINSVELANSMLYSSYTGKTVDLPLDGAKYERALKKWIRDSKFVKKAAPKRKKQQDMTSSF